MAATSQGLGYVSPAENVSRGPARAGENLGLLYQGLLTSIVRLQTGRQHITDGQSFRERTKAALSEVERAALAAGYETADVRDAHFAVVAFLDEVVLNSSDPVRAEWERRMMQEELFGKNDAGVVFFEKLANLQSRRDSLFLADTLEIYLLCMLLGFQGRHSGTQKGAIENIAAAVGKRIRDIRGSSGELSPHGIPDDQPVTMRVNEVQPAAYFPEMVAGAFAITAILFLILYWNLSLLSERVLDALAHGG